jgi:2-methylcitrate dehydratase PrpD
MRLIRKLSNHVVQTTFDKLPPKVVDKAKQSILDNLGNLLAGRYSEKGRGLIQYAARWKHLHEATIPGYGKVAVEAAAFANAGLSRVMDLDDGHRAGMGHPGVVIIPSVLALGELLVSSGEEIIAAIVAAYDVYIEIGSAINPSSYTKKGFDTTGVAGGVAVAAAAAKLHNLNEEKTKNAMAIAALHAGGFIEYLSDGSAGKILCPGWATATAFRALEVVKCGFTGPDTVLEGKKGLFQCFSDKYDVSNFGAGLGKNYHILTTYFKVHACLRRLHPAVDALLLLREKYSLTPSTVKAITVNTGPFVVEADNTRPHTLVGAQGSLPFTLAVALKHGSISKATLEAGMNDSEIRQVEDIVTVVLSKSILQHQQAHPSDWGAVALEIEATDGKKVSEWMPIAFGEPEKPLSWEQVQDKFTRLVSMTELAPATDTLVEAVKLFETYRRVNDFTVML